MNDQDHRTDCSAQRHDHTIQKVEGGFPHSEIPGSKLVRSSPRLIAAYHVLHRLSAPRHPPNALISLDHSHDRYPLGPRSQAEHLIRKTRVPILSDRSLAEHACKVHVVKRNLASPISPLTELTASKHVPSLRFHRSPPRISVDIDVRRTL